MPLSPEMLGILKEARQERIRNKTQEKERGRKGEFSARLRRRLRQGPPAHVLMQMTDAQKRRDKAVRGVSEVGYIGMVKSRAGWKMRNPNLWKELECGIGSEGSADGQSS